jgi:hypothetical protein
VDELKSHERFLMELRLLFVKILYFQESTTKSIEILKAIKFKISETSDSYLFSREMMK